MASKNYPVVQRLKLEERSPYAGFLIGIEVPDWHLLHFWNGELVLDGYLLIPHATVQEMRPEKRNGVYHRLQRAAGIGPEDPELKGGTLQTLLESVRQKWPLVLIYRKQHGMSELDVGWIQEIEEDRFSYAEVAPNGDVREKESVMFEEILLLGFGGSYTEMLGKIIGHRGGR